MSAKEEILNNVFIKHWEWDVLPDWDNIEDNSQQALVLACYDHEKKNVLASYPWRRCIKYITLDLIASTIDGMYGFQCLLPEGFLKEYGFWADNQRGIKLFDECCISGNLLLSKRNKVTLGYIADTPEEDWDIWLKEYFECYLAAELARVGGQPTDREQLLKQECLLSFSRAKNRDYEMTPKATNPSLMQFCEWY